MKVNSQKTLDSRQNKESQKQKLEQLTNSYSVKNHERGFTLIELIIYIGLLTIMVFILSSIFITILDSQTSSRDTSNVAIDGRFVYSRFIYDVSRAESVITPADYATPSSSLTLRIDGENHTYTLDNDNLVITTPAGTNTLNGEGTRISSLTFSKVGTTSAKPTVQLTFTINGRTPAKGVVNQQVFQTTAGLR